MKRYLLILAMIPVMLILWKLVVSANCLHAWRYNPDVAPPTQYDRSFAAFAFFIALLTPFLIGMIAAIIAHYKKCRPYWPILETVVVASVYLMFIVVMGFSKFFLMKFEHMAVIGIVGASCLVGGVVAVVPMNLEPCVRQRNWGKFANSVLVFAGGMLYLFWLYAFIIYVDT